MGHKQTWHRGFGMSALPPIADIEWSGSDVRFVPQAAVDRLYSITSSARTSSDGGTERPSALAVLRFSLVSYFVGA